ncbi:MAG: LacI family DNA-binding transcriptional regulator [Clostridiaceae bacterium]
MAITIVDVAKEAGVSITTVSRVMNNNYPVKKETREKIEKAIEKLNYIPNVMARSLITNKTYTLGIVVPGITNLFFPTIVEAIELSIKEWGYSIYLSNSSGDFIDEKKIIEGMLVRKVDGIIAVDPTRENIENNFLNEISRQVPFIVINGLSDMGNCNFVSYDEKVGTSQAFEYLYKLGHRKIAFMRGYKSFSYDIKEEVYKEFINEYKLDYQSIINVGDGNSSEVVDNSELKCEKILNSIDRPTAIFTCNELMAVGILNLCSHFNINIPKDLSVIACDNTLLSRISKPKLTSIDLNIKKVGKIAAEELINMINKNRKECEKVVIDTGLIIRDSCSKIE